MGRIGHCGEAAPSSADLGPLVPRTLAGKASGRPKRYVGSASDVQQIPVQDYGELLRTAAGESSGKPSSDT